MAGILDKESEYFESIKDELLAKARGEFVLIGKIKDEMKVVDTFTTQADRDHGCYLAEG